MNKLTVVTDASKTVGCTMTGSLKFPKYFSWGFLVEKRDRFHVRLPNDAAGRHLSTRHTSKSAQSVPTSVLEKCACASGACFLPGVLSKTCIKA